MHAPPHATHDLTDCMLQAQDDLGEGVTVIEKDRIVHANDAYCRLVGRTQEELATMSSIELVAPEARAAVIERFLARRASPLTSDRYETTLVRGDGSRVHVEIALRVMPGPDGPRVVSLVRDRTLLHEAQQAALDHAVTRTLVRRLLQNLGRRQAPLMRELGRGLARDFKSDGIEGYLKAFRAMGLGNLVVEEAQAQRARFRGDDLLERNTDATAPTCQLALGFLEAALGQIHGRAALGTEVRCQSQRHESCVFVVAIRG